jgi:hypothetical protein
MTLIITSKPGIPPEHFDRAVRGAVAKHYPDAPEPEFKNDENGDLTATVMVGGFKPELYLDELLAPIVASSSSQVSRLYDELEQTLPINVAKENPPNT